MTLKRSFSFLSFFVALASICWAGVPGTLSSGDSGLCGSSTWMISSRVGSGLSLNSAGGVGNSPGTGFSGSPT